MGQPGHHPFICLDYLANDLTFLYFSSPVCKKGIMLRTYLVVCLGGLSEMVPSEVSSPRFTVSDGTDMHSSQERSCGFPLHPLCFPGMALGTLDSALSCLHFLCDDLFKSEKVIRRGAST